MRSVKSLVKMMEMTMIPIVAMGAGYKLPRIAKRSKYERSEATEHAHLAGISGYCGAAEKD